MIGRVCVKVAGRDAGKVCVIVEDLGKGYVTIDGGTRRRKCNIKHLELLDDVVKVSKGASHADVVKVLKKYGVVGRKGKSKAKTVRLRKKHKVAKKKVVKKKKSKAKVEEKVKETKVATKKKKVKKAKKVTKK